MAQTNLSVRVNEEDKKNFMNQESQTPHKRRVRYKGKYPKKFEEKYKELQPEKYKDTIEHVISKGNTPAGMHIPIMVQEILENTHSAHKPEVDFHYLMPGHKKYSNICRCVRHSIGILPNGDVVACFWALDSNTDTVDPKFLLGNVRDNPLLEILNNEKARYWSDCEHYCELSSETTNSLIRSEFHNVLSA